MIEDLVIEEGIVEEAWINYETRLFRQDDLVSWLFSQ